MSWSVNAKGTPSEVKTILVGSFDYAKKGTAFYLEENKTVIQAEEITNNVLDYLIASKHDYVEVEGNGSQIRTIEGTNAIGNLSFNLNIRPWKSK